MNNQTIQMAALVALSVTFLAAPVSRAQSLVTTTTAGAVTEVGSETLVIRTERDSPPVRYRVSPRTTYVDEAGAPVSPELVRSGLPVTVSYVREGDDAIATRVIVRTAVVPAAAPTVIERNTTITPPPVVVEKKVFVDRPVAVEKKVYVDRPVVVEKPVIVEKRVLPAPPAQVIEESTTTTTTRTDARPTHREKEEAKRELKSDYRADKKAIDHPER